LQVLFKHLQEKLIITEVSHIRPYFYVLQTRASIKLLLASYAWQVYHRNLDVVGETEGITIPNYSMAR